MIVGTAALRDVDFLDDIVAAHGPRVVVSVDVRGGRIATSGWTQVTDLPALEAFTRLHDRGVEERRRTRRRVNAWEAGMSVTCGPSAVAIRPPRTSTELDDARAVRVDDVVEEVDVLQRRGADDHPLRPGMERVAHRVDGPPARRRTARARPCSRRCGADVRSSAARPRGPVEVDEVQEARAGVDPRLRRRQRVVVVDGLGVEAAMRQADRVPVAVSMAGIEDQAAAPVARPG